MFLWASYVLGQDMWWVRRWPVVGVGAVLLLSLVSLSCVACYALFVWLVMSSLGGE
jgi:hypothetical protein